MAVSEDYCSLYSQVVSTEENDRAAQTVVRNFKQKLHLRVIDRDVYGRCHCNKFTELGIYV